MNGAIPLLPLYAFVTWKGTCTLSVIRFDLMSSRVTSTCSPTHTRLLLESVNIIVALLLLLLLLSSSSKTTTATF